MTSIASVPSEQMLRRVSTTCLAKRDAWARVLTVTPNSADVGGKGRTMAQARHV